MRTYLDKFIVYPFLDFIFSSKLVRRGYLEEPGEQVRSLVKSDFLPYPIEVPVFLNLDGISYIFSQLVDKN